MIARTVLLYAILSSSLYAADWMQWRGSNHDGISTETGLLESWPEGGPKLLWKADGLGDGYSNISFANDMIYGMGDRDDGCFLYALDVNGGKERWSLKVGDPGASKGNAFQGPRCTPATDGKLVFAIGQFGDFVCAEAETGKECWRVNVAEQYGGFVSKSPKSGGQWDFSMSPILDGNRVVLPIGGEGGTVIAFEKSADGPKILWRSKEIIDGAAYTSLVPLTLGGKPQYVLLTIQTLAGLDPEDGQVLWKIPFLAGGFEVCSDPVFRKDGENTCYIMAARKYIGALGHKLVHQDGRFDIKRIFYERRLESHHGGIVRMGDHFYMLTERELACVDPVTGNILWSDRSVGKGSILGIDGKLIVRSEAGDGTVALVEATPEGYKELSRFDQPDRSDKNSWTHPVVYNGKLYLRDRGLLLCYDVAFPHASADPRTP